MIDYVKALHIIFVVCWFAALFYMPRLLIYNTEAAAKQEPERSILSTQFKIMQRRLWYGISWPAMVLTYIFGFWTSFMNFSFYYTQAWFYLKLAFVFALTLYHLYTHILFKRQQKDIFTWTSMRLRLWNEIATLLLFIIVFLVVLKQNNSWVWGGLGVILLGATLYIATLIYKRSRENDLKKQAQQTPQIPQVAQTNTTPPPPAPPSIP